MGLRQPTAGKIQVGGSRKSSFRKFQNDDFVVTEMAAVHLFQVTANMTCIITDERALLEQFVILALQARRCVTATIFMQDGAPPHIARCLNQLLRHHFLI